MKLEDKHIQQIKNSVCVVTGGAGFIGSNLVAELLNIGAKKVIVLDDLSTGYEENLVEFKNHSNFKFINASITEFESCLTAFETADIVFQMAALGSVPRSIDNPIASNEVNVSGFLNVLEAAKISGVKKVVYSSSSSVYGDDDHLPKIEEFTGNPLSPYAVTKKANELYAKTFADLYEMDIIGLRYFNVFGPKQRMTGAYAAVIPIFINNLLNNEPCAINGTGEISRDFTYVKNVVEANILAACKKEDAHQVYNIAMGGQLSLNDLYDILESSIQSGLEPVHNDPRPGDILSSMANINKAKKGLKYKPSVGLVHGLQMTIDWNKNQKKSD